MKRLNRCWFLTLAISTWMALSFSAADSTLLAKSIANLDGRVELGGQALAEAEVVMYAASGAEAPQKIVTVKTNAEGSFKLFDIAVPDGSVSYLIARDPSKAVALLSILGQDVPGQVVVNELTTVASAFTSARFFDGESLSGNPLGLRIAAGNTPNLVDPATGKWGKVLVDPLNSTQTTTLAKLNTLGSMITAFGTVADDAWRAKLLKAATPPGGEAPKNTLEAMVGIARSPWAAPKELYSLVRSGLPATEGRLPAQRALRAVSRLRSG